MMMVRKWFVLALMMLVATVVVADEVFPKEGWVEKPDPLANPEAYVGGEINIFGGQFPKSLNYYTDNSTFGATVFGSMYGSLLGGNSVSLDEAPGIAEKWSISDDKKVFTFWIDPKAKWSDGKPITAEDVKWTFDTVMDEKNLTGPYKILFGRFESVDVLEPLVVQFKAKDVHWSNLGTAGGINVLPKHVFDGKDFNKLAFDFPVVSGRYIIGEVKRGISITIERRDDYWRKDYAGEQFIGNFQTMRFKFFADRQNAYESFKKGEIDIYPVYTSRIWVTETDGEPFVNNWIVKQAVYNYEPARLQGWCMNMRREPFKDVRVRKAMALLLNRYKMNETIMYSQYKMHKSYWEDLWGAEHPCPREPLPFDKDAARKLLAEAGWVVNPDTGILEKDGKPFKFRILERDGSFNKFNAIYQEDLKDVGIQVEFDQKDWTAWVRDMETYNFDMTSCAWGSGLYKDPETMWHTDSGDDPSGNNYPGFSDPRVDALIEKQKSIFDVNKRHDIVREIDGIIYEQHPYALSWYAPYIRMLYWNKFGTPKTVLTKYGSESSAYWFWYYDEDLAIELEDAMKDGLPMPGRPAEVHYDEVMGK